MVVAPTILQGGLLIWSDWSFNCISQYSVNLIGLHGCYGNKCCKNLLVYTYIYIYIKLQFDLVVWGSLTLAPTSPNINNTRELFSIAHWKLSTSFGVQERGFLPETVVNFIALLGWSPGSGQEVFTMEELVRLFSLEGVTKRAMIVEEEKLLWTNKQHFRQKLKRSAERQQLARQLQGILQSSSLKWVWI